VRRLLLTVPVLSGVATLVFSLIHEHPLEEAEAQRRRLIGEGWIAL